MKNQFVISLGKFGAFVQSYSSLIFFVFVSLLLGYAIYSMGTAVITTLGQEVPSTEITIKSFDQKTIDDVAKLQLSSDQSSDTVRLPTTRPNPLVE